MISRRVLCLLAAGLLAAAGCSRSAIVPVTVVVTMDGEPLVMANVMLQPETGSTSSSGSGTTDSSGKATIASGPYLFTDAILVDKTNVQQFLK